MRTMYLRHITVAGGIVLLTLALAACGMFDSSKLTGVSETVDETERLNFIMGDSEITAWGAQYQAGNTYFMLNVPLAGALKVEYRITTGAAFALFLETTDTVKLEIGLLTREDPLSGEQVTDVLESVCVTYEEEAIFASMPANIEPEVQGTWTHYHRVTTDSERGDEDTIDWWPTDAEFVFAGTTTTICPIESSDVQVSDVSGPFPKPAPTPASQSSTPVSPFLDVVVSVVSGGGTSDIYEFDVQEPGGGARMGYMFDDAGLNFGDSTTGDADSVVVDQNWASGADPFHMSVPAGATIDGDYQAVVSNQWGSSSSSCFQDPLQVTIEVTTHSASQTFDCEIDCDASDDNAKILMTFPAGTISSLECD